MPHFMIYLCAPSDANGNPRRAWIAFSADGQPLAIYPEAYGGLTEAIKDFRVRMLALIAPRINVSPAELRDWRKKVANR